MLVASCSLNVIRRPDTSVEGRSLLYQSSDPSMESVSTRTMPEKFTNVIWGNMLLHCPCLGISAGSEVFP